MNVLVHDLAHIYSHSSMWTAAVQYATIFGWICYQNKSVFMKIINMHITGRNHTRISWALSGLKASSASSPSDSEPEVNASEIAGLGGFCSADGVADFAPIAGFRGGRTCGHSFSGLRIRIFNIRAREFDLLGIYRRYYSQVLWPGIRITSFLQ